MQSQVMPSIGSSLPSPSSSSTSPWPKEHAERVIFMVVPRPPSSSFSSLHSTTPSTASVPCLMEWNALTGLVQLVAVQQQQQQHEHDEDATAGSILDVIDIDDLIGASLEIQMNTNPNSTSTAGMQQQQTQQHQHQPSGSSGSDIDDDDVDAAQSLRRALNEPVSDVLADRNGAAILHLYVYPRRPPRPRSWWKRYFGSTNDHNNTQTRDSQPRSVTEYEKWGSRYSSHRAYRVAPCEDLQHVQALVRALHVIAHGRTIDQQQPRYLIIANPKSGPKRNAEQLAMHVVVPMLQQSGVLCDVLVTTHAKHAWQRMLPMTASSTTTTEIEKQQQQQHQTGSSHDDSATTLDISHYDGLVLMGGDGLLHEALNGLWQRPDREQLLSTRLRIGMIGCGTGNGFATSLTHAALERYGPLDETYLIAKNQSVRMDVAQYYTQHHSYLSHMTYSWAMIADVDIESECIHWLGELRFDVWAVYRTAFLRHYRGRLSFLPAAATTTSDGNSSLSTTVLTDARPAPRASNDSNSSVTPALLLPSDAGNSSSSNSVLPPFSEPVPSDWLVLEDDFVLLWASQVTHAAMHTHVSPYSHASDGVFCIFILRGKNISRWTIVRALLGLERGTHVHLPGVDWVICSAYRLEPLSAGSYNDIDGEVVESGPIQAVVIPQSVPFFGNDRRRRQQERH